MHPVLLLLALVPAQGPADARPTVSEYRVPRSCECGPFCGCGCQLGGPCLCQCRQDTRGFGFGIGIGFGFGFGSGYREPFYPPPYASPFARYPYRPWWAYRYPRR